MNLQELFDKLQVDGDVQSVSVSISGTHEGYVDVSLKGGSACQYIFDSSNEVQFAGWMVLPDPSYIPARKIYQQDVIMNVDQKTYSDPSVDIDALYAHKCRWKNGKYVYE